MKVKPVVVAILIVIGVVIVLLSTTNEKATRRVAVEGASAPDFELRDVNGNIWRLSDMKGSVVLINFWATWCETCRDELPSLQRLYDMTKNKSNFRLVSIIFRDDPKRAYFYMNENNYTFPVLIDSDGAVSIAYGLTGVPETFVVDKKGILRKKIIGPASFDSPDAIAYLTKLIEE